MTIKSTDFNLPGQVKKYSGKVRDVYTLEGGIVAMVATDRLSAFDVVLGKQVPHKGQILNQLAAYFLKATEDVAPNWLVATPDPNVSVGRQAEPFAIEVIVRGVLVGSAWRSYQSGARALCGNMLPDGLSEYESFETPILTPTTKAAAGHDEDTTPEEIIASGVATADEWSQIAEYSQKLFARGQAMAAERGLVLADTKYEFGKLPNGTIIVIDEIHTPDSSRYFYKDGYDAYINRVSDDEPQQLSKEFVRKWLMSQGFSGQDGVEAPELSDEFVKQVSDAYTKLYELLVGERFLPDNAADPLKRIEQNLTNYIKENL